ncbi:Tat (twin-arginine translocation) pathway signal sequence domain protein [Lysobacter enzymogenes]|uniref:Tat (Twin-arginine translocation) pathway signal sequence domain protein n=1 Tax=Lysobacter enzymogenes TaxID=69 RepID=A0A0S2DAT0_LYSEN|nr:hypothetical protein [Lysobacter enzymogenes]ALN55625.1 Tat (twin-arginine translocation) pathway signal sequence domain protein [Lysobacter enzymogenes]QCW24654.1 hypothetical protein FE772_02170 [Lysobacter enzymogenes]
MERRKFIGVPLAMTAAAATAALTSGASVAQQSSLVDAKDVGYSPVDGGTVARSVQNKLREGLSVKDFGAIGDGVADDSGAFAQAAAAVGQVYVPVGDYAVTAEPALGKFYGPGRVRIGSARAYVHPLPGPVNEIHADVFGLAANEHADSAAALQAAVDYANDRAIALALPAGRRIRVDATVVVKLAAAAVGDPARRFLLKGNNCEIMANVAGPALHLAPQCPVGGVPGLEVGYFQIDNLRFNGYFANESGLAGRCAIKIGEIGKKFAGFQKCQLRDVFALGFNAPTIKLTGALTRMVNFDRVVVNDGGLEIVASEDASFIGDLDFNNCQFGGTAANPPIRIESAGAGTSSEIRGVRFYGSVIYGPGTLLYAHRKGRIGDIWFNSMQWEGNSNPIGAHALWIALDNNADLFQVFINDPYVVGFNGNAMLFERFGAATVKAVSVRGAKINEIMTAQYRPIVLTQFDNTSILDCDFFGQIAADSCVSVYNASNVAISRCRSTPNAATPYFAEISGSSNRVLLANNIADTRTDFVANTASGSVVTDNNINF